MLILMSLGRGTVTPIVAYEATDKLGLVGTNVILFNILLTLNWPIAIPIVPFIELIKLSIV
jgi:hypothetical protein